MPPLSHINLTPGEQLVLILAPVMRSFSVSETTPDYVFGLTELKVASAFRRGY